jgi:hypothetical protein
MTTGIIVAVFLIGFGVARANSSERACARIYVHGSECLNLGLDADLSSCGDRLVRIGTIKCGAGNANAVVVGMRRKFKVKLEQRAGLAFGDAQWRLVGLQEI